MTWLGLALMGLFLGAGIAAAGWCYMEGQKSWRVSLGRLSVALRFYAECRAGHHPPPQPEPEDEDTVEDETDERFHAWVTSSGLAGAQADDYVGMYEALRGRRRVDPPTLKTYRQRLLNAGAPLPEKQAAPLD